MNLKHKEVFETIKQKYWYNYYKKWNFTYFYNTDNSWYKNEIWFIEFIPAWKYLKTMYCQFFDYYNKEICENIEKLIVDIYKQQRIWLPVEWCIATQTQNVII